MTVAASRNRPRALPYDEVVRAWTRSRAASGSLALLDRDLEDGDPLLGQLRSVGIRAEVYREHLQALVRLGRREPDVVVVSTTMSEVLPRLVSALRSEISAPVLLAFGADELDVIGPAVAAGALPVVERPFRFTQILPSLRDHWPLRGTGGCRRVVGDLVLVVDGYEASLGGRRVELTTGEFGLLNLLADGADHVVLRDELGHRLWPASPDPRGALVAAVTRVRRKLAAVGAPQAICTVRGIGYRLEAAALRAPLPTAAPQRD